MRVYYLDRALNDEEVTFFSEALETAVEQIQIPHVLPAPHLDGGHPVRAILDHETVVKHLRKAGISQDSGKQVGLVIPNDDHWHAAFNKAICLETGYYPYNIQTAEHRRLLGVPGDMRILDFDGLAGRKD